MSSTSPPGPDDSSTSRSLKCEQCGGMNFSTTKEPADHNRNDQGSG